MKTLLIALVTLLVGAVFQLLLCVPFNLSYPGFLLELVLLVIIIAYVLTSNDNDDFLLTRVLGIPATAIVLVIVYFVIGSPLCNLTLYKNSVTIAEPIKVEYSTSTVQLIDKDSASKLGDRIFGNIGQEKVSQFKVGEYTQSVYNGRLVRVAPVEYAGFFSWLNNKVTPGYIIVDCETGESKIIEAELKYVKSAFLGKDLRRHLFFSGISNIYSDKYLELDEDGQPYYVVPTLTQKCGSLTDVKGIALVNATTGETNFYSVENAPEWVDNVYPIDVMYSKYNRSQRYVNGLFNFSHKGVVEFTEDYSYLMNDGHLYFYTGVTSVSSDESNIGYAYVDCRTGEVHYTESFGAEEFSARSSAEGVLQEKGYTSVFPTLVDLEGHEVYFMALKDNAGLIKAYALVDFKDYQIAVVADTPEEVAKKYLSKVSGNNVTEVTADVFEIEISKIEKVVIEGNTIVIIVDSNENIYSYNMNNGDLKVALLEVGDTISVSVIGSEIVKVEKRAK